MEKDIIKTIALTVFIMFVGSILLAWSFLFHPYDYEMSWRLSFDLITALATICSLTISILFLIVAKNAYDKISIANDLLKEQLTAVTELYKILSNVKFWIYERNATNGRYLLMNMVTPLPEYPPDKQQFRKSEEFKSEMNRLYVVLTHGVQKKLTSLEEVADNPFLPREIADPLRRIVPRKHHYYKNADSECSEEYFGKWIEIRLAFEVSQFADGAFDVGRFQGQQMQFGYFVNLIIDVLKASEKWVAKKAPLSFELNFRIPPRPEADNFVSRVD